MSTNSLIQLPGARKLWLLVASIAMMFAFAGLPQAAFAADAPPAPNGVAINSSTNEDTTKTLNTTILHDARFMIVTTTPTHGTISATGPDASTPPKWQITYQPGADQTATATFSYYLCEIGNCAANRGTSALVTVTINPINDAPQATADTAITNKNMPTTIDVKSNDNAGPNEGTAVTLVGIVAAPAHGTAVITADQKVLYTPTTDYCSATPDTFTYRIQDSGGLEAIGQVSVTVKCPAAAVGPKLKLSAPYMITSNSFKVDLILESPDANVAAVDFNLELGACIVDVDSPTNNGFAGDINNPNSGTDDVSNLLPGAFFFDAKDTEADLLSPPNIVHFIAGVSSGNPAVILAGPTQASRSIASIQLKSGTSACAGYPSTTLDLSDAIFTAPNGTDITNGTVEDKTVNLSTAINATPTNVTLGNTVPVKSNATAGTYVGTLNTTDADAGDTYTYMILSQAPAAIFGIKAQPYNNEIEVTSAPDHTVGTYTLSVKSTDSYGASVTKNVTVVVTQFVPPNVAPDAIDDTATVTTTTKINVIANDDDSDDALPATPSCNACVVQSVTNGTHGIVVNNGINVTYVLTDTNGGGMTDSFSYTLLDGSATDPKTDTATVNVTIAPAATLGKLGDCNNNTSIDAGDLTAIGLEYFDGDGLLWYNAYKGNYTKFNPYGCNSNKDKNIDAGDLTCTVRKIFNPSFNCAVATAASSSSATLAVANGVNATRGGTVSVPVTLSAQGNAVSGAAFALTFDAASFDFAGVQFNTGNDLMNSVNATADGRVEIVLVDSSLAPSAFADGTIATINLTVKESATDGTSTISLSESSLGTVDGQSVSVAEENGSVQIGEQAEFNSFIYIPYIGR